MPIKVIFLDAGGTLLHPARPVGETYATFAARYGQNWQAEILTAGFRSAFKKARPRTTHEPVSRNGDERPFWRRVVREALSAVAVPESFPFDSWFEELYAAYAQPELWLLYPETLLVLETLRRRGVRLALLSNWDSRLRPLLNGHGLTPFFEQIIISGEQGAEKPDTAFYELAAERLCIAPHEALMVGDDPTNDYDAPQDAGWQALLIDRQQNDLRSVLDWLTTDADSVAD